MNARKRVVLDQVPYTQLTPESLEMLADPRAPVIESQADLRTALAQRFLANADAGDDAANDDLVAMLGQWQRRRG